MPQKLVWLVTGCSSGFGEQFVHEILGRGDRIIAATRGDTSRLDHLQKLGAATVSVDIVASQEVLTKKVEEYTAIYGRIDVLVNNAGYVAAGTIEESSDEDVFSQLNTNLFGALRMTRAVLPHLRNQKSGFIVFIGSSSGWEGLPSSGSYSASKFALEGVYECLKPEIAGFGIQSMLFVPGHFRTPVLNPGRVDYCTPTIAEYAPLNQGVSSLLQGMDAHQPGDTVKVVKTMVDVVRGEGVGEGKERPIRLPLGSDALEVIRRKCRDTLQICDEWEQVIKSTDIVESTNAGAEDILPEE